MARVVVDGVEQRAYDEVSPPVFSADGKHFGYAARDAGQMLLVVDGVESEQRWDGVVADSRLAFDADGKLRALMVRGTECLRVEATLP